MLLDRKDLSMSSAGIGVTLTLSSRYPDSSAILMSRAEASQHKADGLSVERGKMTTRTRFEARDRMWNEGRETNHPNIATSLEMAFNNRGLVVRKRSPRWIYIGRIRPRLDDAVSRSIPKESLSLIKLTSSEEYPNRAEAKRKTMYENQCPFYRPIHQTKYL